MAAKYPSFASAAADDLACSICFHFFVSPHEPKNLPKCSHMCCSLCLRKMTEGGLKTVKCPQCNKVSNLPDEGVDGLITSLIVRNLAEKHPEGIKQRKEHMQKELEHQTQRKTEQLKEKVKTKQQIEASIEQEVREIEKAVESVMMQARMQAQEMVQQIRDLSWPKLTENQQEIKQLEQQIKEMEQSQSKLDTITDGEFQSQIDAFVNQIEKLKINKLTNGKDDHSTAKFVAQDIQLGRIVKPRRLEQLQEFGRFDGAWGIASKPNGTLVVSDVRSNPPQVHVYKYNNDVYEKQLQFNIEQAQPLDAINVAVSTDDKYLVTNRHAGFEVYSSDGKYQKTLRVTTDPKLNVIACSITTTRDGRILVGSVINGDREEPAKYIITVHDTVGKILKTIPIRIRPMQVADMCGMNVVVTYWEQPKVYVYNLETGKETLNLDIPMAAGVCHDVESDCLLIGRATEVSQSGKAAAGSCVIEQ